MAAESASGAATRVPRSAVPSLAVVGFMGSGKSSVGALVATAAGVRFVDTDAAVTAARGSISALFAAGGEAAFRREERDVAVAALAGAAEEPRVVALGGGAVLSGDVRDALARVAHVAWLTAPAAVLWERVCRAGEAGRPLATDQATFARLLAERSAVYAQVATVRVVNDGLRPRDEVVAELAQLLRPVPAL